MSLTERPLAEQVNELVWYHTIDLPGGVTTPGLFDVRGPLPSLPMPASLAGMRCLDIGTCDGFYAFEMERRGAAEVVAVDLADPNRRDLTPGARSAEGSTTRAVRTFALVHEVLDSKVEWRDLSVYDLSPEAVGEFDFVFMGSLLMHLENPFAALRAVASVTRGSFLSYDAISLSLSVLRRRTPAAHLHGDNRMEWWVPNRAARVRELEAAGWKVESSGPTSWVKRRPERIRFRAFRRRPVATVVLRYGGVPHTWVLARPR